MDYAEKIRTDKGDLPVMASAIKEGTPIPGLTETQKTVGELKKDLDDIGVRVYNLEHGGAGVTTDMRDSLWTIIQKAAYATPLTDAEKNAFINAWHIGEDPGKEVMRIEAVYYGEAEIDVGTDVETLRSYLTVTAYYTDFTHETVQAYTISGEIEAGHNTITVTYHGKSATFNVSGKVPEPIDTSPRILYENKTWSTSGTADNLTGSCLTEFYEFTPDLEGIKETRYWDETNQYATTDGAFYTIAYIAPNTGGVAFSSKGKTKYTLADGSFDGYYYSTARTTDAENLFQSRKQKPEICIADNYPLKISFNLTTEDKENSYAYWKASTYTGLTPVGTRDGDIIFAGRNTPYYGMRNISEYTGG